MKDNVLYGALQEYATSLGKAFAVTIPYNPEDQLKRPVSELIEHTAAALDLSANTVTEAQVEQVLGRPDIAVLAGGLLEGYIELKAPGKGANTGRFVGRDKKQWERFKDLPNVIYTDGNEWALYRDGERVGNLVRLTGDVTSDGKRAVTERDAASLLVLLRDFMFWDPVVPSKPSDLASMLAPICRLLRSDVQDALADSTSNLSSLAADWRRYLFPDAGDAQFADAYAQTLTYALLLAQFSGADDLSIAEASSTLRTGHRLLADTLSILGNYGARREIQVSTDLLERVIGAVEPTLLEMDHREDVWLYFYEDFLDKYDPEMRKSRGVYYTPVPVVQAQIHLVAELLHNKFGAAYSFVDPNVVTLDPGVGTGTYILSAVRHGLNQVEEAKGRGLRAEYASHAAQNVYGFEILVGPYTVAHLRLSQQILAEGGKVPEDGVHIYLTDTLEAPDVKHQEFPAVYRALGEEHERARQVKADIPVMVCMGNPPYDRQQIAEGSDETRKGGWVRFGTKDEKGILDDFLSPLADMGLGVHAKNLYNDYIYFWRWALWKVFEQKSGPGIVSFITASSYLRGPGFAGMRQFMRQTLDELWIIDLHGDNLGARTSENVFAIRTPVAIAVGVRYGEAQPEQPAQVHYVSFEGTREEKFARLSAVQGFGDLTFRSCPDDWQSPFLPTSAKAYWDWPLLTDIFPWQQNGMQFKRTWPIGPTPAILEQRWRALLASSNRGQAFKETRDRKVIGYWYQSIDTPELRLQPIAELLKDEACPTPSPIAYRSFDRQYALIDNRLGDYLRPALQRAHSSQQIYMTSLLTKVLGGGPATIATDLLPDMDCFSGRGARDVIPLWLDAEAMRSNVTDGLVEALNRLMGCKLTAVDLFAYSYALLATPLYTCTYWDELTIPGPRLPVTREASLFAETAALGKKLLWVHTFGHRFVPEGYREGELPSGRVRCEVGTPQTAEAYPTSYSYSADEQVLYVGGGKFSGVRSEVWEYSISGLQVVKSWLDYRLKDPAGRRSSLLDDIVPAVWSFDGELIDLLWVLDATIDLLPECDRLFQQVLDSDIVTEDQLPHPTKAEHEGKEIHAQQMGLTL